MSLITELNGIRRRCAASGLPMPAAHFITEGEVADVAVELWAMHNSTASEDQQLTVAHVTRALLGRGVQFMGCHVRASKLLDPA